MQKNFRRLLLCGTFALSQAISFAHADTLEQIYDLALKNDPEIRGAEAQLQANSQTRTIGRAALLPQINGSASYQESETSFASGADDRETSGKTYSASLSQVLFDLPSWYNYKQSDASAEQAEKIYLLAKQDLIVRTITAYLDVLRAIDSLATIQSEEKAVASQLDQATQRFDVGLIAVTDVHEAQAAYDDVVARLFLAQGSLGIAFEGLGVLTGQDHRSIAPLLETFPVTNPTPEDSQSWVDIALERNNSLASARLSRDAARYNSKSSRLEHMPSLSLGLRYSDSRPDGDGQLNPATGQLDSNDSDTASISLTLNVPIFTGGRTSAQRRQAYYQYVQAEESLNGTQRTLIQNTRSLHLSALTGVSTVNARKQAITSSESALEATQAGYDVGTRNLVELLQAERALYAAQLAYYNARYDYILDMLNLKLSAGILSSEDLEYYNRYLDAAGQIPRNAILNN